MPKESDILVSVIVPLYNVERYVGECVGSLLLQTYPGFEVVCVDDCSTDGSLAAAREAAAGDERFSFIERPVNGGLSVARNTGIEAARGEYLVFLDSDDLLLPEALEELVDRARQQDLDDLFFSAAVFYENEEAHAAHDEVFSERCDCPQAMSGQELFAWFISCGGIWPQAPYHMVRRSLLNDARIRFYEGILHEDELYTVQTLCAAKRAGYLNKQLYARRVHTNSIMTTPRGIRNVEGVFRVLLEMRAWMQEHADECSPEFVDAYAFNMSVLYRTLVRDARACAPAELEAFAESLPAHERLDFYVGVRDEIRSIEGYQHEILESATYRFGDALVRVPRKVRDTLTKLGSGEAPA